MAVKSETYMKYRIIKNVNAYLILLILTSIISGCGGEASEIEIELTVDSTLIKHAQLNQYKIILELELNENRAFIVEHGFDISAQPTSVKHFHDLPISAYIADIEIAEYKPAATSEMEMLYNTRIENYSDSNSFDTSYSYRIQNFSNKRMVESSIKVSTEGSKKLIYTITVSDAELHTFNDISNLGIRMITAGGVEYHESSMSRKSELELNKRSGAYGIGTVPEQSIETAYHQGTQIRTNIMHSTLLLGNSLYHAETMQHTNQVISVSLKAP